MSGFLRPYAFLGAMALVVAGCEQPAGQADGMALRREERAQEPAADRNQLLSELEALESEFAGRPWSRTSWRYGVHQDPQSGERSAMACLSALDRPSMASPAADLCVSLDPDGWVFVGPIHSEPVECRGTGCGMRLLADQTVIEVGTIPMAYERDGGYFGESIIYVPDRRGFLAAISGRERLLLEAPIKGGGRLTLSFRVAELDWERLGMSSPLVDGARQDTAGETELEISRSIIEGALAFPKVMR